MRFKCNFSFHISVVFAVIVYIYFLTVFVSIDRWFGLISSPGLLNFAVFTYLFIMTILTYLLSIFTDPGRVPASFLPDIDDPDSLHEVKRKVSFLFLSLLEFLTLLLIFFFCILFYIPVLYSQSIDFPESSKEYWNNVMIFLYFILYMYECM